MRALNRTPMAMKYAGQWVALKSDRKTVVASGRTLKQALKTAHEKGCAEPVLTKMPATVRSFVGFNRAA